ncbi:MULTISPECIES: hypothetical protein [Planktothricoides]|uniref:Transposase n=2 Tax=Planktothricoides raciborskii TaxID=132608 RepID=A0AAU8JLU0_9CYAN|nr:MULTISPECIES: hypothetical protein [Planktothricoides]MBD2545679.1 hypothetical protein [Planktothricoides raciborskii FACHB-1370]MBD2582749.1 hypothetical protein [Planktothricoides raciborskii FACHB-1261]
MSFLTRDSLSSAIHDYWSEMSDLPENQPQTSRNRLTTDSFLRMIVL